MAITARAVVLAWASAALWFAPAPVAGAEPDTGVEVEEPLPLLGTDAGTEQAEQRDVPPLLEPVEARDPRVIEADGYLGQRDTYDKAIELYRAYLAEHPGDEAVRLRLARVLSWRGHLGQALVEYKAIAHGGSELVVRLEHAEALSWAGRYREAEAGFRAILAAEPANARAARGLARVFLWSGRSHEADRAYMRALEMEDDGEARAEWEGLHALYRPQVKTGVSRRSDNDDYFFQSVDTEGTTYLDLRTRVTGEVSYWRTRGEVQRRDGSSDRRGLDAASYRFGVERHFGPSWLVLTKLGHEAWVGAPNQVVANAELRFTPSDQASVSLAYEHSGAGRALESFDAALEGIHRDDFSLSLWHELPRGFEVWSRIGGGLVSDSNSRLRGEVSLDYKPLEERELRFHLASSVLRYSDDSALYYDPDLDIDNELGAEYTQPLLFRTRLRVEAAAGYGVSRERGQTSDGFVFRTGSYLWWEWRRWALELGGTFSQSRRDSVYRSHFFTVSLSRSF